MVIEVMAILIVLGAAMVFIVRRLKAVKGEEREGTEELRFASGQFKEELEHTGEEIIQRMGKQVEELERLLQEANNRIATLHGEIAQGQVVERNVRQQLARMEALELERQMQRSAEIPLPLQRDMSAMQMVQVPVVQAIPVQQSVPMPQADPQEESLQPAMQNVQTQELSMERAALEEKSEEELTEELEPSIFDGQEAFQEVTASQNANSRADAVRKLLLVGKTVEETAKETGMGRGAIELMNEILKRAPQRKSG